MNEVITYKDMLNGKLRKVSPEIDAAFEYLYTHSTPEFIKPGFHTMEEMRSYPPKLLSEKVYNEFNTKLAPHIPQLFGDRKKQEDYFNCFTPIWNYLNKFANIELINDLWDVALTPVLAWEREAEVRIHKGSPYFFNGVSYILRNNIEKGYINFHISFEEDKKSNQEDNPGVAFNFPDTPSYALITLDPKEANHFRNWIELINENILEDYINSFNTKYNKTFDLNSLRSKVLLDSSLFEYSYQFSYICSNALDFIKNKLIYDQNTKINFQIITRFYFDLAKLIAGLISYKNYHPEWSFRNHLENYKSHVPLVYSIDNAKITEFENARKANPSGTFTKLLNNQTQFAVDSSIPHEIDKDYLLALGIRNQFAHNITSIQILCAKRREISERLFHLLFAVIDTMY